MKATWRWLGAAAAVGLLLGTGGVAIARDGDGGPRRVAQAASLSIEATLLLGTNDPAGTSAALKKKFPELGKSPMDKYRTYKEHATHQVTLTKGQPTQIVLPTGELSITLNSIAAKKATVDWTVKDKKGKLVVSGNVTAKPAEHFVVNAGKHNGGELFVVLIFP